MDYLSHNISVNLKRIRAAKGMSLDHVSEQTGVSKSMLHQIEGGGANPSINVLGKIASGLQIELTELLSVPPMDSYLVNIADIIPTKHVPGQYTVWTCFPYEDNRNVEIYRIDIEPGGVYESGGHGEHTREYLAMITGEVTMEVNHEFHTVAENEIFRFESIHTHTYSNRQEQKASFMSFFVIL